MKIKLPVEIEVEFDESKDSLIAISDLVYSNIKEAFQDIDNYAKFKCWFGNYIEVKEKE